MDKCEKCMESFFKTEKDTCIYCNARKNGGPACKKCKLELETNLICDSSNISNKENTLSSMNKCFNCKDELGQGCEKWEFFFNEENEEKLK